MTTLYFILALAFASFAVFMLCCLIWASLVRCKKCGGWCGDDKAECEQNLREKGGGVMKFRRCPDCNAAIKQRKSEIFYRCLRCDQMFSQAYLKGYWLGFLRGKQSRKEKGLI